MTNISYFETKLRKVSNKRPKSLILSIPATVRDIMEFEHGTSVKIEVCLDDKTKKKYIKIYAKD